MPTGSVSLVGMWSNVSPVNNEEFVKVETFKKKIHPSSLEDQVLSQNIPP